MVTRSSIDPIEEARARVRLRYMRGRAVKQPMAQIGLAAERLTRKVGGKKMPAIQMLKARWREIAIGLRGREVVEITSGLSPGDVVLSPATPGSGPLRDGRRIARP